MTGAQAQDDWEPFRAGVHCNLGTAGLVHCLCLPFFVLCDVTPEPSIGVMQHYVIDFESSAVWS